MVPAVVSLADRAPGVAAQQVRLGTPYLTTIIPVMPGWSVQT